MKQKNRSILTMSILVAASLTTTLAHGAKVGDAAPTFSNVQNHLGKKVSLSDFKGTVGRLYGARSTPHMFVISPKGKLLYAGAIDDHPSADPSDIPSAKNYVRESLNASMAGRKIATTSTRAYGCSVKHKR